MNWLGDRRPEAALADKGYDTDSILSHLAERNIQAVIPPRFHCDRRHLNARTNKVARSMFKRITTVAMQHRVGETFSGVITERTTKASGCVSSHHRSKARLFRETKASTSATRSASNSSAPIRNAPPSTSQECRPLAASFALRETGRQPESERRGC